MKPLVERRLDVEAPFATIVYSDIAGEPCEKNLHREVWQIAWPSVLTFALMTTNAILDRAFVGQLGRDALAAVGVGGQVIFLLVSLSMAITVGTTALVARFTGAGEPEKAVRAAGQSIALSLVIGIVCSIAVLAGMNWFLNAVGLQPTPQAHCRAFLHMALIGMVPMFLSAVVGAAVRGLGDTRTPLKVMICANIVHVVGDWALIFGRLGLPKLGLAGAGIAISLSQTVSLGVYLALLRKTSLADATDRRHLRLTMEWTRRILKIGIPAAVTAILRTTSLMSFTGVLSRTVEGMAAVAALPIGLTAESIAFMPGFGFSIAASALVGQSLGAGRPDRAERFGWAATWQATAIMSLMGAVFFVAAEPFASLFTRDPAVHKLAVSYMRIMAISEPMLGVGMVLTGALQGAGETIKPAILTAVSFWVLRLPMAWLFALVLQYQTLGAWVAMSATTIVGGVLTVWLFKSGTWKRVKV